MYKREPRKGCVEFVNNRYVFSDIGLAHVRELSALGQSEPEIAQYLRISKECIRQKLEPDHENFDQAVADARDDGLHELKRRIREAQLNLTGTNAQMAIHMGRFHLGQKDVQEVQVTKRVHIVGTIPDYKEDPSKWLEKFGPAAAAPKQLDVIDATFEEKDNAAG